LLFLTYYSVDALFFTRPPSFTSSSKLLSYL
jgi:hypothetical protein